MVKHGQIRQITGIRTCIIFFFHHFLQSAPLHFLWIIPNYYQLLNKREFLLISKLIQIPHLQNLPPDSFSKKNPPVFDGPGDLQEVYPDCTFCLLQKKRNSFMCV